MDNDTPLAIVVGFDCSPDAAYALDWAAEQSHREQIPLRVLIARGDLYTVSSWADDWSRGLAEEWAVRARKQLAELGRQEVPVAIADGLASKALVAASRQASLVVVGSHGHAALVGLFQGSVSQHVTRHASCPVAVVRPAQPEAFPCVVVGVDGSAASFHALEYAIALATRRGWAVSVYYCPQRWQGYGESRPAELPPALLTELETRESLVKQEILEAGGRAGVVLDLHEGPGHPSHELVQASRSASAMVVGSRGRGALAGMLLGSVSSDVVRHAHCPVIVVR